MATDRQKKYYRQQRLNADQGAKEGDLNAQKQASKIYGKLGRSVPADERAGSGKPGASEGDQMMNLAGALQGGGMVKDAVFPMAEATADAAQGAVRGIGGRLMQALGRGGEQQAGKQAGRQAIGRGGARVIGKAKVSPAEGPVTGRSAPRAALKPAQKALGPGKAAKPAKAPSKPGKPVSDDARTVNPRAAGTSLRQRGVSPRQIAAKRAAAEKEAAAAKAPAKDTSLKSKILNKVAAKKPRTGS